VDVSNHGVGVVTEFDLLKAITDGKDMQTVQATKIMGRPASASKKTTELTS
jgi:hypothetical protein